MYIYSSLYLGRYFLFLLTASNTHPVKLYFREKETPLKKERAVGPWREKIYLYPAIIPRKWLEYKYRERFIPAVTFDNVLPCEISYNFINKINEFSEIQLRTFDKSYKNPCFQILNEEEKIVYQTRLSSVTPRKKETLRFRLKQTGIFHMRLSTQEDTLQLSVIIFVQNNLPELKYNESIEKLKNCSIYCDFCKCRVYPFETKVIQRFLYKNYIPFKEYIDIERLGIHFISNFIMKLRHPVTFKRGLVHLLNIIRLASTDDEITIVTNLFKDEPAFAYFITDRLFFFEMIPLMVDRDLQNILNTMDEGDIAKSLSGESRLLIDKVLNNISKRRARFVLNEMNTGRDEKGNIKLKYSMHTRIKHFFEEKFGRVLKIPYMDKVVYKAKKPFETDAEPAIEHHSGNYLVIHKPEIVHMSSSSDNNDNCLPFDIECYCDRIFNVVGITESTIYLKSEIGTRYTFIHIYNWISNIEDSELIENISPHMVIPLKYRSSGLILTVGAISSRGLPMEQVIRLRIRPREKKDSAPGDTNRGRKPGSVSWLPSGSSSLV
jgi:hypothetical protein